MTEAELKNDLKQIQQTQDERQQKFYSWLKTLITISIGLFGILVSFKSDSDSSFYKSIFFIVALTSLGLGILFGLILLYSEVHILDKTRSKLTEYTIRKLDGNHDSLEFEQIKPSFFYKISAKLCYFFYIISLIFLICYSLIDELKNVVN